MVITVHGMLVVIFLVVSFRCLLFNSLVRQSSEGQQEGKFVALVCFVWTKI